MNEQDIESFFDKYEYAKEQGLIPVDDDEMHQIEAYRTLLHGECSYEVMDFITNNPCVVSLIEGWRKTINEYLEEQGDLNDIGD